MNGGFKSKKLSPKTLRLRTSFDCLIQKVQPSPQNTPIRLQKINLSKGKPYKFPEYEDASDSCYSPSSYQNPLKKNIFRIEKIEKFDKMFMQKNYKFKKACNTSYKSQKTQRFQKTIVAFEDLQQIDSITIRRFKQESEETIRIKEAQKIHEILANKRRNSTIFVGKDEIGNKNRIRIKDDPKRFYLNQSPSHALSQNIKKYVNTKNLLITDHMNKTASFFGKNPQIQTIDAWNTPSQIQIGIAQNKFRNRSQISKNYVGLKFFS